MGVEVVICSRREITGVGQRCSRSSGREHRQHGRDSSPGICGPFHRRQRSVRYNTGDLYLWSSGNCRLGSRHFALLFLGCRGGGRRHQVVGLLYVIHDGARVRRTENWKKGRFKSSWLIKQMNPLVWEAMLRTITIFYGPSSGSEFWQVTVSVQAP